MKRLAPFPTKRYQLVGFGAPTSILINHAFASRATWRSKERRQRKRCPRGAATATGDRLRIQTYPQFLKLVFLFILFFLVFILFIGPNFFLKSWG